MYQNGMSREQAKELLREKIRANGGEVVLINDNDGDEARLNMGAVGKLVSDPAVKNSTDSGFTAEQHYAVAADISNIYQDSLKLWLHPDMDGNPDIVAFHRYATPLHSGNAVALVTVKESTGHGRKIYAVEVLEIKRLEDVLGELRERARNSQTTSSDNPPRATMKHGDRPSIIGSSGVDMSGGTKVARRYGLSPTSTAPKLYNDNIRDLTVAVKGKIENPEK